MPRSSSLPSTRGFTLVEAVIVIAIMAILASAATPLLMRSLTQQRSRQTQDLVRSAYEAMVGARDRTVPNLVADVGFAPPAGTLNDLRILTTQNPAGGWPTGVTPPAYPTAATGFTWGWNGPYWTGPIQIQAGTNGLPADGWGRAFRWTLNQVQSRGPDGNWGTGDDLVYPPTPASPPAMANLQVTVERQLPPPAGPPPAGPPPPAVATFTVQVTDRNRQVLRTQTATWPLPSPPLMLTFPASDARTTNPFPPALALVPGAIFIQVTSPVAGNQSQTITLAPGEARVVLFRFNR